MYQSILFFVNENISFKCGITGIQVSIEQDSPTVSAQVSRGITELQYCVWVICSLTEV